MRTCGRGCRRCGPTTASKHQCPPTLRQLISRSDLLFKQVDQQRGGAFREQCALAVAVADGAALRQHQSINARLLCANSYLDLDQVEPASRYYAEAIELAKRMYPDGWREVVKLTYWTNISGCTQFGGAIPEGCADRGRYVGTKQKDGISARLPQIGR